MWSMVAQRLTQITPPAATPDQLWQRVEAAWSAVPQEHVQSLFESIPRRVAVGGLFVLSSVIFSDWSRGQRSVTPPHNLWVSGTFLTHPTEKEFNHIRSGDS
ncbi:transposable element Tcb1 transposase [Trichonephila clavipes]|nr:transposable element Tcb1 transposase [Trichonephila clavipes]